MPLVDATRRSLAFALGVTPPRDDARARGGSPSDGAIGIPVVRRVALAATALIVVPAALHVLASLDAHSLLTVVVAAAAAAAFGSTLVAVVATRDRVRAESLARSVTALERQRERAAHDLAEATAELRWTRSAVGAPARGPGASGASAARGGAGASVLPGPAIPLVDAAARLAHEVAGPLTGIVTRAELALEDEPEGEVRASLEAIRDDALQAAAISRSMLARARGVVVVGRPMDPAAVARRVVERHRQDDPRAGRTLTSLAADAGVLAVADPIAVDQVLDNLVRNAVAATRQGGRIQVLVRRHAGAIEVQVVDDGIGMDRRTLARAFEPFFTTRAGVGTGLGLAISRDLAVAMGGSLTAASTPGRGTTMTLRLPEADADDLAPAGAWACADAAARLDGSRSPGAVA